MDAGAVGQRPRRVDAGGSPDADMNLTHSFLLYIKPQPKKG